MKVEAKNPAEQIELNLSVITFYFVLYVFFFFLTSSEVMELWKSK